MNYNFKNDSNNKNDFLKQANNMNMKTEQKKIILVWDLLASNLIE